MGDREASSVYMFFMIEHLAQNQVTRLKPGRQMCTMYVAHYSKVSSGIQGVLFTLKLLFCPIAVQKYFMTKPKKMFVTKTFWVNVPWEQSSTYLYTVLRPFVVLSKLKHTKTSLTKKSYCYLIFPNVESYYFKNCMKLLLCYHSHHSSLTQRCIIVHAGAG